MRPRFRPGGQTSELSSLPTGVRVQLVEVGYSKASYFSSSERRRAALVAAKRAIRSAINSDDTTDLWLRAVLCFLYSDQFPHLHHWLSGSEDIADWDTKSSLFGLELRRAGSEGESSRLPVFVGVAALRTVSGTYAAFKNFEKAGGKGIRLEKDRPVRFSEGPKLFVDTRFQGRGFARTLVEEVLRSAENWEVDAVLSQSSPIARGFYKKFGWEELVGPAEESQEGGGNALGDMLAQPETKMMLDLRNHSCLSRNCVLASCRIL